MKSIIFLTFLAVLFGCICSSGNELVDRNGVAKTQLSELVDDVFFITFPHLELKDLMNLVEADSRLSRIAGLEVHFRYRNDRKLQIYYFDSHSGIYDTRNFINIHGVQMSLNMLKFFGQCFQSIIFTSDPNTEMNNLDRFIDYISKYCSTSLKALHLDMRHDLLEKFTKPMEALEELKIQLETETFSVTIRMNEIFPKLRQLNLFAFECSNFLFYQQRIFTLHPFFPIDDVNNENVRELIRKNPTIQSICALVKDPEMVKFINQHLPNIETLTILDVGIYPLVFENLKNLTFFSGNIDAIYNLTIPRLVILTMKYNDRYSSKWMEFFLKSHITSSLIHRTIV